MDSSGIARQVSRGHATSRPQAGGPSGSGRLEARTPPRSLAKETAALEKKDGGGLIFPPYEIQEDLHPNYWAQLALRNCLTQAYNGGTPKGGTCTISGGGLNSAGQPNMSLH
jgi:hypothetical protein